MMIDAWNDFIRSVKKSLLIFPLVYPFVIPFGVYVRDYELDWTVDTMITTLFYLVNFDFSYPADAANACKLLFWAVMATLAVDFFVVQKFLKKWEYNQKDII